MGAASIHQYVAKDYRSSLKPIWCPGCGDFGVVSAVYRALALMGLRRNSAGGFGSIVPIPGEGGGFG